MEIAAFIDWIAVTHHNENGALLFQGLPATSLAAKPRNGYTIAYQYGIGVIEMRNPDHKRMGIHYIYSGKVLQQIETVFGVTRDEILRRHATLGAKFSRIDFAIDAKNAGINLLQLWEELETYQAITLSKHSRVQTGRNGGDTVYIGSKKTRQKMLRIYDKAKEMGDYVSDWIRIELETRGTPARNAARAYQDNDYSPESIASFVRGVCDFPCNVEWCTVCSATPSKIPSGNHQATNREKWLLQTVAPSLAQACIDNSEFFDEFAKHVRFHYNKLNTSTS